MSWKKFTRTRSIDHESPMITLSKSHFYYSAVAARILELAKGKRVIYHIDESNKKIGFEFVSEDESHSYSVFSKSSGSGFRSSPQDVYATHYWVKSVALLSNSIDRKFRLKKEGKLWVAQLCPAFEIKIERAKLVTVPEEASGIYRYVSNGITVYIGKGAIRGRSNEIGRDSWQFDTVEYSIVSEDDQQYEWESYWIDRFKEENNDALPSYNLVAGHAS